MDELDIILAIGIVAVLSLSTITNFYFIRYFSRRFEAMASSKSKPETESEEEETESDEEQEPEEAEGAPSKEQILARRAS